MRRSVRLRGAQSQESGPFPSRLQPPTMPLSIDEKEVDRRVVYDLGGTHLTYVVDPDSDAEKMLHGFTTPEKALDYLRSVKPDNGTGVVPVHPGVAALMAARERLPKDDGRQVVTLHSKPGIQEGDHWNIFFERGKGWTRGDFRQIKTGGFLGIGRKDLNDKAQALFAFANPGWAIYLFEHIYQQGARIVIRTSPVSYRRDILNLAALGFSRIASSSDAAWIG